MMGRPLLRPPCSAVRPGGCLPAPSGLRPTDRMRQSMDDLLGGVQVTLSPQLGLEIPDLVLQLLSLGAQNFDRDRRLTQQLTDVCGDARPAPRGLFIQAID